MQSDVASVSSRPWSEVGGWSDMRPHEADDAAVGFTRRCAALLVVLPGHPTKGPLYITRGLVRVMDTFPWSPDSAGPVHAYLALVHLSARAYTRSR